MFCFFGTHQSLLEKAGFTISLRKWPSSYDWFYYNKLSAHSITFENVLHISFQFSVPFKFWNSHVQWCIQVCLLTLINVRTIRWKSNMRGWFDRALELGQIIFCTNCWIFFKVSGKKVLLCKVAWWAKSAYVEIRQLKTFIYNSKHFISFFLYEKPPIQTLL